MTGNAPSFAKLLPRIFLPFALAYFLSYIFRGVNAVIFPYLERDIGITAADLGLLTAGDDHEIPVENAVVDHRLSTHAQDEVLALAEQRKQQRLVDQLIDLVAAQRDAGRTEYFELRARVFRFANVVGPRQTHGVGLDFARRLQADPRRLRILGDGTQSKSYIHVLDVLEAVRIAHHQGTEPFDVFNVGTGDAITVTEICGVRANAKPNCGAISVWMRMRRRQ